MSVSELMAAQVGKNTKTTEDLIRELNQFSRLDRIVGGMSTLDSNKGSVSVFNDAAAESSQPTASKSTESEAHGRKRVSGNFLCNDDCML